MSAKEFRPRSHDQNLRLKQGKRSTRQTIAVDALKTAGGFAVSLHNWGPRHKPRTVSFETDVRWGETPMCVLITQGRYKWYRRRDGAWTWRERGWMFVEEDDVIEAGRYQYEFPEPVQWICVYNHATSFGSRGKQKTRLFSRKAILAAGEQLQIPKGQTLVIGDGSVTCGLTTYRVLDSIEGPATVVAREETLGLLIWQNLPST